MEQYRDLPTGTIGAIAELVVSADLMAHGIPVFRALSPNCKFDLAIAHRSRLLGIEVRTAYQRRESKLIDFMGKHQGADLFGLFVHGTTKVFYFPVSDQGREFCELFNLTQAESTVKIRLTNSKRQSIE